MSKLYVSRVLCILIAFLLVFQAGVTSAGFNTRSAYAATAGNFSFEIIAGTATITGYSGLGGDVTIPTTVAYEGSSYSVTAIGDYAFRYTSGLTSIAIPSSVISIGKDAFGFTGLTSISVESGNTQYSSMDGILYNFDRSELIRCPRGKSGAVVIPSSVIRLGDLCFDSCTNLSSIIIPTSVTSIGVQAFHYCSRLSGITIPTSVTSIGDYAFSQCPSLTSIAIPNGVTSIGTGCFADSGLTSVSIPTSVISIGDIAFAGCGYLPSITIPNGVTKIGESCFARSGLTNITIPTSVTSIGSYTFFKCGKLTSITIPTSVTNIGDYAFSECTSLTSITIPNSVASIGDYVFKYCGKLASITVLYGVTNMGVGIFDSCRSLTSISIPSSVTSIGNRTFNLCESLTSISIPSSVTSMGDYAFNNCYKLSSIAIPSSVTRIGEGCFTGCVSMTSITIPDSVTTIGESCFYACLGLTSITIPTSVTSIGDNVFSVCRNLMNISVSTGNTKYSSLNGVLYNYNKTLLIKYPEGKTGAFDIPNSVFRLGKGAFSQSFSLTNISIPNSVTSIEDYAFEGCWILTGISVPNSVTNIGDYAFSDCRSLTSISIPSSVTNIGNYTFSECKSLTSVDISACIANIGEYCFKDCYELTNINIPNSVTSLGNYAFQGCWSLTNITIPNSVTSIGDNAFQFCSSLESVTIPICMTSIGSGAFDSCTSLTDITFKSPTTVINYSLVTIPTQTIIFGYDQSTARSYASYNGREFRSIGTLAEKDLVIKYGIDKMVCGETNKTATYSTTWSELLFALPSTTYNHSLAKLSIALCAAAGNQEHIKTAINQMGDAYPLQKYYEGEGSSDKDKAAFTIGHTSIGGKELVIVVVRGTVGAEWQSDFELCSEDVFPAINSVHFGFESARKKLDEALNEYMSSTINFPDGVDKDNTLILITGHSRGAAVANLEAKILTESQKYAYKENIYGYTFATPNVAYLEQNPESYNNIFNIINAEDFIPTVPLKKWEYSKYGINYYLPLNIFSNNDTITRFKSKFTETTSVAYQFYPNGPLDITKFDNEVFDKASSPTEYYDIDYLTSNGLMSTFDYFLCIARWLINDDITNTAALVGASIGVPFSLEGFNPLSRYLVGNIERIAHAHAPETYLCWLDTIGRADLITQMEYDNTSFTTLRINCPVDVFIYDSNNNLVGSVVNNVVYEGTQDTVYITVDDDSKVVFLPNSDTYHYKLIATDEGVLNYSVTLSDMNEGDSLRMNFYDIPLNSGKEMLGNVQLPEIYTDQADYAMNILNDGQVVGNVCVDEVIQDTNFDSIVISTDAEWGGTVTTSSLYTKGDRIELTALPYEGYTFAGWYEDGLRIMEAEEQYIFIAMEDRNLQAKWTPITYAIKFSGNGATFGSMPDLAMTYEAAQSLPANCFLKTGYTFAGWATSAAGPVAYANQESVTNLAASEGETVTLYAVWTPNSYTIKFSGNGSTSGTMSSLAMTYDMAKTLPTNVFKKTGYAFLGWATSATGSVAYKDLASVKNLTATNGATITLYAKWGAPITTVTSYNYKSIKVSWAYAGSASAYKIYRATSATGTYSLVYTASSTARSWVNTGLVTGKTYYYKVYPVAGGKTYAHSTYKYAKAIPTTPTVTLSKASTTSIKVTWTGVSGATKYQVYRATSATGTYSLVYTASSTLRSWTNTSLTAGKTYYYKVRAYHLEGSTNVYGGYSTVRYYTL